MPEKRKRSPAGGKERQKQDALALRAENALSGVVLFPVVGVDPGKTIGQLCKRLQICPWACDSRSCPSTASPPFTHHHFKHLKEDLPCIRLWPVSMGSRCRCRACSAYLFGLINSACLSPFFFKLLPTTCTITDNRHTLRITSYHHEGQLWLPAELIYYILLPSAVVYDISFGISLTLTLTHPNSPITSP